LVDGLNKNVFEFIHLKCEKMMENNQMNEKWTMDCVENVVLNAFDNN
jgi:hypothetical protein